MPETYLPPILNNKPVAEMDEKERLELIQLLRDWMANDKQPREANYLAGREVRQRAQYGQPAPTQTDRDYQMDQVYEKRLIELLETLLPPKQTGN